MLDWLFYWQNFNNTKMTSNNTIKTELVGSIVYGLKFLSGWCLKIFCYVDFRKKECTNIIKSIFFKETSLNCYFKVAIFVIAPGFSVAVFSIVWLYHKWRSYDVWFLSIRHGRVFHQLGPVHLTLLTTTQKNRFLKKWKTCLKISF